MQCYYQTGSIISLIRWLMQKKEGEYIVFLTQGGKEVCRVKDEAGGEGLYLLDF